MNPPINNTETSLQSDAEKEINLKTALLDFAENELNRMSEVIYPLLETRHDLFEVSGTDYSNDLPLADQLYDDPSYNVDFIYHDMSLRKGNASEYHQTTEKYDKGFSESNADRDFKYRQAILQAAQELGFVSKQPGEATSPVDKSLGILDSELKPIDEAVAAVVINGAAGMSNHKRIRDAIRNIESGAINTSRIIITAGKRPVGDAEKGRVKPPYSVGDTEYESMKLATQDLLGVSFEDEPAVIPVTYGNNLSARIEKTTASIGDKLVEIVAIEAPFDPNRTLADGSGAKRVNTEEVFMAALPLLEGEKGAIVMESHDAWTPWQNLIGHQVFGLTQGRNVYPAGPFNAERVYWSEDNGEKVMDIVAPQDVVDEIAKTYRQLVHMQIMLRST